jgi:hypothetical protein
LEKIKIPLQMVNMKNSILPQIEDINWDELWNNALNKIPEKDAIKMWDKSTTIRSVDENR